MKDSLILYRKVAHFSLFIGSFLGAEETFLLDNSVISATGFYQDIKEAPASITIITKEDILSRPIRDLGDIIQEVPGASTQVGKTGATTIQMRGMASKYTLILIDGKRINMDSGFDSNGFDSTSGFIPPVSMIERVEVLRGPASVIYGSDAMGGVINIITKKNANNPSASIALESRLQQHHSTWGNLYGVNGNLFAPLNEKFSINVRGKLYYGESNKFYWRDIEGYTPNRNTHNPYTSHSPTGYRNFSVGTRINYILDNSNDFYLDFDYGFQRLGSLNTSSSAVTAIRDYHRYNTVLNHNGAYEWGKINTYAQYLNTTRIPHKNVNIGANAGEPNRAALTENQNLILSSQLQKSYDLGNIGAIILTGGPYYKKEKLMKRSDRFNKTSDLFAIFGEGEWFINDYISTVAGLRINYDAFYEDFYNPRFYVNLYPTSYLTLKAGIASGLKVPELGTRYNGLYDIVESSNVAYYGNSTLKAEESLNYELSGILETTYATFTLTGFYTDFNNAISMQTYSENIMLPGNYGLCSYSSCYIYENVDKAKSSGLEFAIKSNALFSNLIPRGIYADFTYALTETERKSGSLSGTDLNDIPRHNLSLKFSHKQTKWDSYVRLVGKIKTPTTNAHSANIGPGAYYKDMYTVDLGVNYRFKNGLVLGAVVNNLLDENFVDYVTYNNGANYTNNYQRMIPGRNLWLTLRVEF